MGILRCIGLQTVCLFFTAKVEHKLSFELAIRNIY